MVSKGGKKLKNKFSIRLQMALNTKNIKPFELSNDTGISKSLISRYLSGKTKPSDDNLEKLAKYLNISQQWLDGYDILVNDNNFDKIPEYVKNSNMESQYYDALFKLGVTDKDGNIDQEKLKRNIKIIEFYNNNFDDK